MALRSLLTLETRHQSTSDESGQMVVELAVVIPVALIVVLVVVNIFSFLEGAARFDQLAPKAVIFCTMETPAVGQEGSVADKIRSQLQHEMGDNSRVLINVVLEGSSQTALLLGSKQTYRCEMAYTPWPAPREFTIAGASTGALSVLKRSYAFTVDSGSPEVIF